MRLCPIFTEGTVPSAEPTGKDIVTVSADYILVIVTGYALGGFVEIIYLSIQVMSHDAVCQIFKKRTEGQSDLQNRIQEAVFEETLHTMVDVIPHIPEGFHLVVCGSLVPDPLQTLEPVMEPGGPALKNEMMLPAVLDPWAAHALYEAAHLATTVPGSSTRCASGSSRTTSCGASARAR